MSATMKAARITAPGEVEVVDAPLPTPAPGYASVRPELVAICGSDLRQVYSRPPDAYPMPTGVSGHEIVGRVEQIVATAGEPAPAIQPGDRVLALMPEVETGMAEQLTTPIGALVPLPDGPSDQLLMAQQLGTVVFGCQQAGNVVAKSAVVIGQGSVGQFFVAMLRRLGADRIMALDLSEARVAAGLRMGADDGFDPRSEDAVARVAQFTDGAMADLVIEAAGETDAINLASRLARRGGRILYFGIPKHDLIELDFMSLFRAQCTTISAGGAAREPGVRSIKLALDLIARGDIDVAQMVSHTFPLAEVGQAYELAHTRGDGALKVAVRIGD